MVAALTDTLERMLEAVIDRDLASRLREVYLACGNCIDNLALINLVKFEPAGHDDGSADLSMWEEMAPALSATVVAVNSLCEDIEFHFPKSRSRVTQFGSDTSDERLEGEAAVVFRSVADRLREEVTEVGEFMRRPELLGSRWRLLGELQRLRADLRSKVGDAFYLSALAMGSVRRDAIVPGFDTDVRRAVVFRATAADVCRFVETALQKPTEVRQKAAAISSNFEVFANMPAWKHVRAEAKREMLYARQQLSAVAAMPNAQADVVTSVVTPVVNHLRAIAKKQTEELLFAHDLEAWSNALLHIDQARLHMSLETRSGLQQLEAALTNADKLRGRNDAADLIVRRVRKESSDARPDEPIVMWVEALHEAMVAIRFA